MIIKNILNKFYIHPINYGIIILVILTGIFKEFIILSCIIIFHEIGHMLGAILFRWEIDKIHLYPFGGCIKFKEAINKPLYQELIIMLMGPSFQIIFYLVILILFNKNYINMKDFYLFKNYHYSILFFNLLPAIPLDGGRLLNILFNYLYPYKKSLKIIIFLAYIIFFSIIGFVLLYYKNFNLLILVIFLITKVFIENKNIDFLYNKFMLDRYLKKYNFKAYKVINNKNNMYRDKKHVIKDNNRYISELEYLKKRFAKK